MAGLRPGDVAGAQLKEGPSGMSPWGGEGPGCAGWAASTCWVSGAVPSQGVREEWGWLCLQEGGPRGPRPPPRRAAEPWPGTRVCLRCDFCHRLQKSPQGRRARGWGYETTAVEADTSHSAPRQGGIPGTRAGQGAAQRRAYAPGKGRKRGRGQGLGAGKRPSDPRAGGASFRLPGPLSLPGLGVSRLPGRLYNACPQPLTLPCPGLIPERPSAHALPGNNLFVAAQHPEGSRVSSATSSALPPWPCHLAPSPHPQGPSNYGLKSALRFLHGKLHSSGKALTRDSFLLPELPDKTSKTRATVSTALPGCRHYCDSSTPSRLFA